MVALPLTAGLPVEMSPARLGAEMAVGCGTAQLLGAGGSWRTVSQVILCSSVPCVPGCTHLLSHRSKDGCALVSIWDRRKVAHPFESI